MGDTTWTVTRGDLFIVPSWQPVSFTSEAGSTDSDSGSLDLFQFGDAPVFEKLHLYRSRGGLPMKLATMRLPGTPETLAPSGSTEAHSSTSAPPM